MVAGLTICINGSYSWLQYHDPPDWGDGECIAGCKSFDTWEPSIEDFYEAWRFLERTGVWRYHDGKR